jgi:hypothetical protein
LLVGKKNNFEEAISPSEEEDAEFMNKRTLKASTKNGTNALFSSQFE